VAAHRRDILAEVYRAQGKTDEEIEKLDLKDDVLRRANGFYTYFAADIAYHRNKFESAASTRSSTSGAPTTTAMWPASRARWTPWGWTARTGWTSC
jgi:arginyl-tRNA synthetase